MATETQIKDQLRAGLKIFEEKRKESVAAADGGNVSNTVELIAAFEAALAGTQIPRTTAAFKVLRAAMCSFLASSASIVNPLLIDYAKVLGVANSSLSAAEAFYLVYRDYAENSKRVTSRGFVFGSASAGASNVGKATITRLNFDEYGFVLENQTPDTKTLRCVADAVSGGVAKFEESWTIEGEAAGEDALEEAGSGQKSKVFQGLSARTSTSFGVTNPSFSSFLGTTSAPTDLSGWTSTVTVNGTNFTLSTGTAGTEYFRDYQGDTTPYALNCLNTSAWKLSQNLQTNSATFATDVAYYVHVAIRRRSSANGSFILSLGNASTTVDLTTLTNDQWVLVKIGVSKDNWYRTFGKDGLTLSLERTGGSTGTVDVDDITVGEFFFFDGGYWVVTGGTSAGSTPPRVNDTFTCADSLGVSPVPTIQPGMVRSTGGYLPACPATPTAAPSRALAGAGAGNVDNGAHTYAKTWVDGNGIESGISASASALTVVDKTSDGKVTVGRNETSPGAHIAYWRVYRSKAGTTTPLYLVASVAVGTSSYTDNTADSSLPTTTPPTGVTLTEPS